MNERIERLMRTTSRARGVIGLGGGLPSNLLFPRKELGDCFVRVLSEPNCAALQYGWPEGDAELRGWIAARLAARGADVGPDDVIVTNGAQQALGLAVERLATVGSRVGVDLEAYPAALDLFRATGVAPVRPEDGDWAYAMPGVTNPRGEGLSEERRRALLGLGIPLIADEAYAELRFDGASCRPLLADAPERTWHVGTFSKTLSPGLRVGWLVPPRDEHAAVLRAKRDRDLEAGGLAQAIVRTFLTHDDFEARLECARTFYGRRAQRLAESLRRRLPTWRFEDPEGGFSIFAETDLEGDDVTLLECAAGRGVTFDPGCLFRARDTTRGLAMRLCYSSAPEEYLDEAVKRLGEAAGDFNHRAAPARNARALERSHRSAQP